ncbi:MAG: S46 family peptidase, partial [Bacteroidales bacterium]|nr:S46 family peptidase [Bacteroidales bacterium]
AGSSNYWKKAMGMNETFKKLKVQERRAEEEVKFQEWVNANAARKAKYGTALDEIRGAVSNRAEALYLSAYLREALGSIELFSVANGFAQYSKLVEEGKTEDAERTLAFAKRRLSAFYKDYSAPTDRKVAKALVKVFRDKVKAESRPAFYNTIDEKFGGNIDAFIDNLYDNSVFTSEEKFTKALENIETLTKDPIVEVVSTIVPVQAKASEVLAKENPVLAKGQKAYIAGQLEMKQGQAMYPDANSTMRMTYGQVLNYSPKDAVIYEHISTLKGVMEKEDPNNWEFVVPEKLKELYKNKDYGQYAMEDGRMPVGFLSTNDITGGNSGSPVLNGKGELIGTAFDGNWEAMSGDIIFEPNLQRTISVDIRYTLFIMDKFGGAGHLLKEMTIVK